MEDLIEELVGEITDEYDKGAPLIEPLANTSDEHGGGTAFRVSARLSTDELGELFDLEVDDEDVDSVGGLLTKALDKLPEPGDHAVVAGLELTAERTQGRRGRLATVVVRRATIEDDE
jgi:CBS domain containing-hemolysin-like protein